ncbi:MAG: hypothetical protein ACT4QA_05670 [Panacagrimonas sp.]
MKLDVRTCTSGAATSITITDINTNYIVCNFGGGVANATGTGVTITLPSAGSYPADTTIEFSTVNTITNNTTTITFISPNSFLFGANVTGASTSSPGVNPIGGSSAATSFKLITDGVMNWYRVSI